MFSRTTWTFVLVVVSAIAVCARSGHAQEPAATDESPAKIAQQVYAQLLAQYRAGEAGGSTHLDLLNNWSERVLMMEFTGSGLVDEVPSEQSVKKAIRDHQTRMQELNRVVETRYKAQLASKAELLAARYFCLEVGRVEQTIQAMQQIFQPVEGDFDIKMPKVDEAKPLKEKAPSVVIDVDARGKITIEGKELTLEQLEHELKRIAKEDPPSAKARIRAHPNGLHRNVMSACRVCAKVGIESISLVIGDDAEEE